MSHVPDQPARRRRRCCPFFLSGSRSLLCLHNDNPPSHNFEPGIWTWGSRRSMNMRMSLSDRSEYAKRFLMETRLCYADNHAPATTRCLIMQTSNRENTSSFRRISASSSYPSSPLIKPALYSPSLHLSVYHHREGDLMEYSGSRPPVPLPEWCPYKVTILEDETTRVPALSRFDQLSHARGGVKLPN